MLLAPVYSASDWAKLMSDNPSLKVIMTSSSDSLAEGFNSVPALGLSQDTRQRMPCGRRARRGGVDCAYSPVSLGNASDASQGYQYPDVAA